MVHLSFEQVMSGDIRIGSLSVSRGQKGAGFCDVLRRPTGSLSFPVQIVNGSRDGPTLLILAGTHACEYAGIEAAIRMFTTTNPNNLNGALICVPVLNTAAFETQTPYVCPLDGLNISGLFPGDESGTASHRIAHSLFNEVALKANYIIDMHSGDLPEDLSPYSIFSRSGNADADAKSEQMARLYEVTVVDDVSRPGMLVHESALRGIPGIVGESGGLGRLREEDVAVHVKGARNIMASFGMTNDKPIPPPKDQRLFKGEKIRVGVTHGGILKLQVKVGEKVEAAQLLGEVVDIQGEKLEELRSPADAFVRILIPKYAVNSGDRVVFLSKLG
jgi:predicted deacylase